MFVTLSLKKYPKKPQSGKVPKYSVLELTFLFQLVYHVIAKQSTCAVIFLRHVLVTTVINLEHTVRRASLPQTFIFNPDFCSRD